MEETRKILQQYLPPGAVDEAAKLLDSFEDLSLKITPERKTKGGDFRQTGFFQYQITVNNNLNPYRFLITFLHEIAHYIAVKKHGKNIQPHGQEWKDIFSGLLNQFIEMKIFPKDIFGPLYYYAKKPRATVYSYPKLDLALKKYDLNQDENLVYLHELKIFKKFKTQDGIVFKLMRKRRTRFECKREKDGTTYLVHKNTKVYPLD